MNIGCLRDILVVLFYSDLWHLPSAAEMTACSHVNNQVHTFQRCTVCCQRSILLGTLVSWGPASSGNISLLWWRSLCGETVRINLWTCVVCSQVLLAGLTGQIGLRQRTNKGRINVTLHVLRKLRAADWSNPKTEGRSGVGRSQSLDRMRSIIS